MVADCDTTWRGTGINDHRYDDEAQADAEFIAHAPEDVDYLLTVAAELDTEKERASRAEACVESGNALLGAVIEAMGSRPDRDPVIAARELLAERDALRARIEAAPHSRVCIGNQAWGKPGDCICWKSAALAGDQHTPAPEVVAR